MSVGHVHLVTRWLILSSAYKSWQSMMVSHRAVDQLNWSTALRDTIMDCQGWYAELSVNHLVTRRPPHYILISMEQHLQQSCTLVLPIPSVVWDVASQEVHASSDVVFLCEPMPHCSQAELIRVKPGIHTETCRLSTFSLVHEEAFSSFRIVSFWGRSCDNVSEASLWAHTVVYALF